MQYHCCNRKQCPVPGSSWHFNCFTVIGIAPRLSGKVATNDLMSSTCVKMWCFSQVQFDLTGYPIFGCLFSVQGVDLSGLSGSTFLQACDKFIIHQYQQIFQQFFLVSQLLEGLVVED